MILSAYGVFGKGDVHKQHFVYDSIAFWRVILGTFYRKTKQKKKVS